MSVCTLVLELIRSSVCIGYVCVHRKDLIGGEVGVGACA